MIRGAKLRARAYVRVSKGEQHSALQRDATANLARQRGWSLERVHADEGISGATDKRPALRELLAAARAGELDVVIVYKLDRMFRSTRELLDTLASLDAWGVKFVSCTEPIDTASPAGKLLTTILAAIGEFERELIRERTRDGVAAARRRGKRVGRPRRIVDTATVRDLRAKRWSYERIARKLGVGVGTVHRAIAAARSS